MTLTSAQLLALKADIAADPVLSSVPHTADGAFEVAAAYNQGAVPTFVVWKTSVPTAECKRAMVWTEFIARSAGERDAWLFMLSNGTINAADANVRQGILDVFSGPGGATTRANLTTLAKRPATRVERLFASGAGTDAAPATMTVEGTLSYADVQAAWSS